MDIAPAFQIGILGDLLQGSNFIAHNPDYGVVWVAGALPEELVLLIMRISIVSLGEPSRAAIKPYGMVKWVNG